MYFVHEVVLSPKRCAGFYARATLKIVTNRILESPWFALAVLIAGDLLMMADVLPRAFAFVLAVGAVAYMLKAPLTGVVAFTVSSVPFSPALPVPGFDSFALWRLIVAVLVLRLLWENRTALKAKPDIAKFKAAMRPYDWVGLALFAWATLSLLAATDLVAGLRKLVFLGNAVALYIALRWLLPRVKDIGKAAVQGLVVGLVGLLLFGIAQYIVITWVSLYDFWQGWSLDVIPIFYGEALGQVLNYSNTWFAYYAAPTPPTLRMFSLLPDSHSFGLTMLLGFLLASVGFALAACRKHRSFALLLVTTFGISIFLNGSRGIWVAAVPTALLAYTVLTSAHKTHRPILARVGKTAVLGFLLLALLFPVSSYVSAKAHGAGIDDATERLDVAFRRAQSIFDFDEASNRGRVGIWITNAKSVLMNPVFGVGIGNTAIALKEDVSAARRGASAHNLYLDFAVETGVLGGLLMLSWFFAVFFTESLRLIRHRFTPKQTALSLVLILLFAWIGVYNLVDIVFLNDRALLASLTLLALVAAQGQAYERAQPLSGT